MSISHTSNRSLLSRLHRIASLAALVLIASFWLATVIVELRGNINEITLVKTAIAWGLIGLIPVLVITGGAGLTLAGGRPSGILKTKLRRMQVIAANGVLVLAPSAITLAIFAQQSRFDEVFIGVQSVELLAGVINICLIGLNIRDGVRLRGAPRKMAQV